MEKTNNTTTRTITNFCNAAVNDLRDCHEITLLALGYTDEVIAESMPKFPDQFYLFLVEQAMDKAIAQIEAGELPRSIMTRRREFAEYLVNYAVGEIVEMDEHRFYTKLFLEKLRRRLTTGVIFLGGKYEDYILQLK